MPDIFHCAPADGGAAIGAREPESLPDTGMQSIELRTERALVDRSHESFSFPSPIGARRKQRRADGRSRQRQQAKHGDDHDYEIEKERAERPRSQMGRCRERNDQSNRMSAMVSSHGQRRRANNRQATPKPTSATPSRRKNTGASSSGTPDAKARASSSAWGPASFGTIPCQIQVKAIAAEASARTRA